MKKLLQRFWPILFLAVLFLALFYKVFFLGKVFYTGDNFHLNIPEKYFFVQQMLQGRFPLWNPYLFTGIPYFADFNLGTLNPTNLLYFLFPIARALTLLTVFDFFGLSVGMYMLLRSYTLSKMSSLFGAIVVSLSGMPFVLLDNMTFMQVIVYIPFLFLLVQKFCKERSFKWLLLLVCVQFLQFISGHPQETYYTIVFISFYFLLFSPFRLWKRILVILFYGLMPILLGSIQLIPFLEYVQHANRPVGSIMYAGWGGQTITTLVTFIFPTFYGSHGDGTWWGTQQILVGFLGIPTLMCLYIAVRFAKFPKKLFVVVGWLLSFFLACGTLTPVFYIFYYLIPGWALFRAPSGILVFYTFFAAILAAFGLEYLQNHQEKFKRLGKIIIWIFCIITVFFVSVYVSANRVGFWKDVLLFLQQHFHRHIFNMLLFYDNTKIQQIFQEILWNVIFVSIFFFVTGVILLFLSKKKYQTLLLLLLTTIGFFIVNTKVILVAPLQFYATEKVISTVLKPVVEGEYRILSIPVNLHQYRQHLPSPDFFYREGLANLSMYQYDNNIERGLYQVAGYTSLVPESFATFIGAKDANTNVTNITFSSVTQKKLNLSSVRYITSYEPIQHFNGIPLQLLASKKNQYIYENKSALPRAYILQGIQGDSISWQKAEASTILLAVTAKNPGHLILTDWYYPGWKAYINAKEVPIRSYLSTFQEIAIPSGKFSVRFVYDPRSIKIGLLISIIACIGWIWCWIALRKKKI